MKLLNYIKSWFGHKENDHEPIVIATEDLLENRIVFIDKKTGLASYANGDLDQIPDGYYARITKQRIKIGEKGKVYSSGDVETVRQLITKPKRA